MDAGRISLGGALAAIALLAGCGDSDEGKPSQATSKATTTAPAKPAKSGLARPVNLRCPVAGYGKPTISRVPGTESVGTSWSLQFQKTGTPQPGDTVTVLVVEYPPGTPLGRRRPGVKDRVIAGHKVLFREPSPKAQVFVAQWKTSRATYSVIATGTRPGAILRFIACLP